MGPWGRKGPVLGGGKGKRGYRDQERGKGGLFVCVVICFSFYLVWVGRKDRVGSHNYEEETLGS